MLKEDVRVNQSLDDAFVTPPHLDHLFIVTDGGTIDAVNACDVIASDAFGRFLIKHSESSLLGKYTATNIFGRSTMIEFFKDRFGTFQYVNTGLVLSFDHAGEHVPARKRLTAAGIEFHGELIRRKVPEEAEPVIWYHQTRPDLGATSPVTLFLSEITPEYFARLGARFGENGRQDRAAYFEALLRRSHGPEHLMGDVTAVTVRLRAEHADRLARILALLGYARSDLGETTDLTGPDALIRVVRDEVATPGLTEIRVGLTRPAPEPGLSLAFGEGATLVLSPGGAQDLHAVWTLTPHQPEAMNSDV